MNTVDYIVIAALAVCLVFSVISIIKKTKNGDCGGDCSHCGKSCDKRNQEDKKDKK